MSRRKKPESAAKAVIRGEVTVRPLSEVSPNPWNPNEMTASEMKSLEHGFKEDGWLKSMSLTVWGEDDHGVARNVIIDGEHRWKVAMSLGMETGPMVFLDGLSETQAKALTIKMDRKRGRFSEDKLSSLLKEIVPKMDPDLASLSLGFSESELASLIKEPGKPPEVTEDEVPEPPAEPVTRPGDLWILGRHRLLCGDATNEEDRKRLIGDSLVDAVITDPPYAIYGSSTGIGADIADDKMVRPFFEAVCRAITTHLKEFGHAYICCDWRSYPALWEGAKRATLSPKNALVWDKGGAGLGSNYANTYELVAFFSRLPPATAMKSTSRSGQRVVHKPNILRYKRVSGEERQHNAAKPVPMLAELVLNSTDQGERVLDLFSGSGSTLMAAEATGRAALMMELEPKWCDVIVARWEAKTKRKAERS